MAVFDLPNGEKLNVPDQYLGDVDMASNIKDVYGIDINEVAYDLDWLADKPKSIARGAVGLAADVPLGLAGLFDIGDDSAAVKGLQGFKDYLREDSALASDPKYRNTYGTKLAEGAGSFIPFLGAGLAGRALASRGVISPMAGAYGVPAALAVPTGMAQQVDRLQMAREMGEDVGAVSETFATLTGGLIGLTEIAPIANLMKKIPKSALRNKETKDAILTKLKSAAQSGALEGGQEVLASVLQDLTARGLYSDELPIGESLFDEFTIGGIIGGTADLVLNSLGPKRNQGNSYLRDREARARKNKVNLQESGKFERAIDQGEVTEYQQPTVVAKPDIPVPPIEGLEPQLEITRLPDGTFAVIDTQAIDSPVLATAPTETEAIVLKDKQFNQFERDKLKSRLDNDLYNMGLGESSTAQEIGATVLDPDSAELDMQTLLNFDTTYKGAKKKARLDFTKAPDDVVKHIEKQGLNFKPTYSMAEAKSFLNKKDFNDLASDMAQVVFAESEKAGMPSIRADKKQLDTSIGAIKALYKSKNIDTAGGADTAFTRFNKISTGTSMYRSMSKGQRELLLAKIHSLPAFNNLTPLPDFSTREYTAKDMADFVAGVGQAEFNGNDVETYLKERFVGRPTKYYSSGLPQTEGGPPITLDQEIEFNNGILMEQVDTFLRDLDTSGRSEFVEGKGTGYLTSVRKVRPNFEFDIARRAEGFNETPEEFGARLTEENKLPKETIDQLVEDEKVKQQKVLPPKEIEPKIMNFQEVIEEGRTNKFAKEIQKKLKQAGLSEVGVVVSNDILSTENLVAGQKGEIVFDPTQTRAQQTEGQYDENTDTIFLSLNAVNPEGTASDIEIQEQLNRIIDGQIIHAFRAKDLITEQEYNYLKKEVKRRKVPQGFDENFKGKTFYDRSKALNNDKAQSLTAEGKGVDAIDELYIESAVAEMYKARNIKPDIPPKAQGIFDKFLNFFKSMGTAMRSSGYKKSSDIFNDIEAGKIGSRERDQIRTFRELDRLPIAAETAPIFETEEKKYDDSDPITPEDVEEFGVTGATFGDVQTGDFVQAKNIPVKGRILGPPKGRETPATPRKTTGLYDRQALTSEEYANDKQLILEALKNKNLIGVMEWFVKNSPSKDYTAIAKSVLYQLKKYKRNGGIDFDIFVADEEFLSQRSSGELAKDIRYLKRKKQTLGGVSMSARGGLNPRIYLSNFNQGFNGINFEVLLHEAIHASTQTAVFMAENSYFFNVDKKLQTNYKNLESLRKRARKEFLARRKAGESQDWFVDYGTKSVDELLAVGFTDRRFQKFLESIPYKQSGVKNLFDAFVNNIRNLLNIPAKENTALSALIKQGGDILSLSEENINITASKMVNAGINAPPVETQRESINDQIKKLQQRLDPLQATMNQEYAVMSNANNLKLSRQIQEIEQQITTLQEQLKNLPPEQKPLFSQSYEDSEPGYFAEKYGSPLDMPLGERVSDRTLEQWLKYHNYESLNVIPDAPKSEGEIEAAYKRNDPVLNETYNVLGDRVDTYFDLYGNGKISKKTYKNPTHRQLLNNFGYGVPSVSSQPFEQNVRSENPSVPLQKAVESAEELTKKTPRGDVPPYNLNASDVALEAAQDFIADPTAPMPKMPVNESAVPEEFKERAKKTGYQRDERTAGERFIDVAADPITSVKKFFADTRQTYIDSLDKLDKKIIEGIETNEEVRLANNLVSTSTMAALRLADRARGVFAQMLTRGVPVDKIDGVDALTSVQEFEFSARYNPFVDGNTGKGGLVQFTAPLYSDPTIDKEYVFGLYAGLKRVKSLNENGVEIDVPSSLRDLELIEQIENNYKDVVEVYNNYQQWNNGLISFAEAKGILSQEQSQLWRTHSAYYPFYRNMVDDTEMSAPAVGGGSLPSNPLSIKMKGSEKELNVPPLEAIARNSLSILTASMKNDGVAKLVRDLELMGDAKEISPSQTPGLDTIFVFENGVKKHILLKDPETFLALQSVGGVKTDMLTKIFAIPAGILRDTVTRDPGFVVVNILRDTLSSAVTSGVKLGIDADSYTPIIDSVKNMFGDMTDLEKFGIIGGYDFANDEGDIVSFMARTRRQQGLSSENGITPESAFYKLWDGLGGLTTKSDGATRKAVYDSVYKSALKDKATEAEAQSAAAYQALEIINFGRRGLSPTFKLVTSAIPFLNARIQGLDVLYRSFSGKYSATEKLQEGETMEELKSRIVKTALQRGLGLMGITVLYYLLVSDTDDYKEAKRETRDDNWLIPTPWDYTVKIPIPFEVGMMFKALPERVVDMAWGQVEKDPLKSITRQLGTSAKIPVFSGDISVQAVKPLFEAITNRNSFTGTEIVPYYKLGLEAGYQANPQTNELARLIGEQLGISPMKIEYVLKGYTGTLGGYALSVIDSMVRTATGSPYIPNNAFNNPTNWAQLPVFKRLLVDSNQMGGLQQQFYELRGEVNKVTQTMNSLKKQKRFDELATYRANNQGTMNVKNQVRSMERYLDNYRKKRDAIMRREDVSVSVKQGLLEDLVLERDKRLAFVPELRKKANVPIFTGNL